MKNMNRTLLILLAAILIALTALGIVGVIIAAQLSHADEAADHARIVQTCKDQGYDGMALADCIITLKGDK